VRQMGSEPIVAATKTLTPLMTAIAPTPEGAPIAWCDNRKREGTSRG
jgi:hypothetical protein